MEEQAPTKGDATCDGDHLPLGTVGSAGAPARYAAVLDVGGRIGLAILTISFLAYATGIVPGFVPVEDLPNYWGMRADQFTAAIGAPTGWGWLEHLDKGDYFSLLSISLLAGLPLACQLAIIPALAKKRELTFLVIAVLQSLLFMLAASGMVTGLR